MILSGLIRLRRFVFPAFSLLIPLFILLAPPVGYPAEKSKDKKEKILKAPAFPRDGVWLTPKPPGRKLFQGKTTLVYFWDYASINTLREIGILKKWDELYKDLGLQMIWIHSPEFPFASRRENVAGAAGRLKIRHPVFLDNDFKLWEAYKVRSWPTKILVNNKGEIIYSSAGENAYAETEKRIRELLKKAKPGVVLPAPLQEKEIEKYSIRHCGMTSNETYAGYKKSEWWGAEIANKQWMPKDKPVTFKDRGDRVEQGFFVEGLWTTRADDMEHARETREFTDYLGMMYVGREVHAVLNQKGDVRDARIEVTRDGVPVPEEFRGKDLLADENGKTFLILRGARLYYLIAKEDPGFHEIKLWVRDEGVSINSFSFSNHCQDDFEHL